MYIKQWSCTAVTATPQLGVQLLTIFAFFQFQITACIVIRARFFFFFPRNGFHFVSVRRCEYRVAVKFSERHHAAQGYSEGHVSCVLLLSAQACTSCCHRKRNKMRPTRYYPPISDNQFFNYACGSISQKSFLQPESQPSP